MDELERKRTEKRRASLDEDGNPWSPEQALQAMLDDIKLGVVKPDAIAIIYSERSEPPNPMSTVGWYAGANGANGLMETFWIQGMIARCLADW